MGRREEESPANGRLKRKNESKRRTINLVVQEPKRKSLIESEDLAGRGKGRVREVFDTATLLILKREQKEINCQWSRTHM